MKIAALMPTPAHLRSAKQNARLNISKYFGLQVVINEIQKEFVCTVPIINYKQCQDYDIILVSVHSVPDFYALAYTYYNRMKGKRSGVWILGGAAVANIPPLLPFADFIVLGRAEDIIIPLITAVRQNQQYNHPSVVISSQYKQSNSYQIAYAQKLYPDTIGKQKETMLGCKYNCSYCRYRVSSLPPNLRQEDKGTTMPGNEETFWELEIKNGSFYTTSLDGLTEQTRHAVVKHISNQAIVDKFFQLSNTRKLINLKIYLICGYPGQSDIDFSELQLIFETVAAYLTDHKWNIKLHITPFSPEPHTPMQWEAAQTNINFRDLAMQKLPKGYQVHKSPCLSVVLLHTIASPFSLMQRLIFNRSWLHDAELIRVLSSTTFFRSHDNTHSQKLEELHKLFDLTPFTQQYEIGTVLSSSNIHSWRNQSSVEKQGEKTRRKLSEIAAL